MRHLNLSLRDADQLALDHANVLWSDHANGPRLDEGGEGGDGGDSGDGGDGGGGEGGSGGEGGEGGAPDLTQQALDAIANLQKTGAQIPDALTAAVNELKNARGEAATYRTKLRDVESKQTQHDQVLQGIAKALGLSDDGDELDPAQLQATVAEKDATIRALKVDGALRDAATKQNADYELTAAVLARGNKLNDLDPDADDFTTALDALVKSTVEANPKLKATQAAGSSGADDFSGGSGGDKKADDLVGALANHYAT